MNNKVIAGISLFLACVFLTSCAKEESELLSVTNVNWSSASPYEDFQMQEEMSHYQGSNVLNYKREDGKESILIYAGHIEHSPAWEEQEEMWENRGDYSEKSVPKTWDSTHPFTAKHGNAQFSVFPAGNVVSKGKLEAYTNAFGQKREGITYADVFDNKKWMVSATPYGFNTELEIPKKTQDNTFRLKVQISNCIPDTTSPDYILFRANKKDGGVESILYTPMVVDQNGKWSYANTISLITKDTATDTYTVEYTLDEAFLQDPSTRYPLKVNQSMHLYKSKQPDTSAYSGTGEIPGHYLSPYMLLGDSTLKGEGWTYVRFETLETLDIPPERVESATYTVHQLMSLPEKASFGVYAVTEDWCSINTRWFSRPSFDEKAVCQTQVSERGDYTFDVTPLLREMLQNKNKDYAPPYSIQNGFLLRCDTPGINALFASGDNGLFSPVLEIVLSPEI